MIRPPRILFISHAASRNGATILLLSFLRWLRPQVDWRIEVLMNGSGPLLETFRAVAPTTVWRDVDTRLHAALPTSAAKLGHALAGAYAGLVLPRGRFDLVYANTAAAAPLAARLGARTGALLWHVHELDYALATLLQDPAHRARFRAATRYVAVSGAVREALAAHHGIEPGRVDLVHGFIESVSRTPSAGAALRAGLRARLGIAADAFVVGACGSLGWRKGSDLFLQLARRFAAAPCREEVAFLWVGGGRGEPAALEFAHDLRRAGLDGHCHLLPATEDAIGCYPAMDAFALTSREDPFPLVALEAAASGLPVVCFDDAGGTPEFVGDDCGLRAPYLDLEAFATHLDRLRLDRPLAMALGATGRAKVAQCHRVDGQGPLLLQAMRQALVDAAAHAPARIDLESPPALPIR